MSSHTTFPQETDAHINVTSPSDVSGEVEYEEEEYDAYDDYEEEWETDAGMCVNLSTKEAADIYRTCLPPWCLHCNTERRCRRGPIPKDCHSPSRAVYYQVLPDG